MLRKVLEQMGLRRLDIEHLVYVLQKGQDKKQQGIFIRLNLVIVVYIDDIMIIGQSIAIIKDFKNQLSSHFDIKDIREALDYLDIKIVWNRVARILKIH